MLTWDTLMMASQAMTLIAALPTIFNTQAYIPRWGSTLLAVGLIGITVSLLGLGAPLGASITGLATCAWVFVFIYRGTPPDRDDLWDGPKGFVARDGPTDRPESLFAHPLIGQGGRDDG